MHAVFRWVLIGVLIMALPLKGLAAAGYLSCDPLHGPASPSAHAQAVDGHASHHHAGDIDLPDPGNSASSSEAPAEEQLAQSGTPKCTQCAPCCGAVAPPLGATPLLCDAGTTELKIAVRPLQLGGDTARLDRPPRSLLA